MLDGTIKNDKQSYEWPLFFIQFATFVYILFHLRYHRIGRFFKKFPGFIPELKIVYYTISKNA